MRVSDVITKLAERIPNHTSEVTANFNVTSMTASGSLVSVNTDQAHGLKIGSNAFILGARTPLTISSTTRITTIITIVTDDVHDITFQTDLKINLIGHVEARFNGEFEVLDVPNRNTIKLITDDSGAVTGTGSPVLLDGASFIQDYNGLHVVVGVPSPTVFTFERDPTLPDPFSDLVSQPIQVRTAPRISGGIRPEDLIRYYTEQKGNDVWLFAILSSSRGSKDRTIESDSNANHPNNTLYRQQVIQSISIFALMPKINDINGIKASDQAQDLFIPICRSILREQFDSLYTVGRQGTLEFVNHQFFGVNDAVYAHQYDFELTSDLTFSDTIGAPLSVAFRDIVPTYSPQVGGTDTLSGDVDLDDEPLP